MVKTRENITEPEIIIEEKYRSKKLKAESKMKGTPDKTKNKTR